MKVRQVRHRGFTLVEAIATIVCLGILGAGTSLVLVNAVDGYADAATQGQLHAEISVALDRMVKELRHVPLDATASVVAPDINSVAAQSMTWETNNTLELSGTDLTLQLSGGTARVLLADVSALTISVYDESNTVLGPTLSGAGCDPIRRVELSVTVTRNGSSETLRTRVFLRSTMTGASV